MILLPNEETIWFNQLMNLKERRSLLIELGQPYNIASEHDDEITNAIKAIDAKILSTLQKINNH